MICFSKDRKIEIQGIKKRYGRDRTYRVLQYARLVMCFSEDRKAEGFRYARLGIGHTYVLQYASDLLIYFSEDRNAGGL